MEKFLRTPREHAYATVVVETGADTEDVAVAICAAILEGSAYVNQEALRDRGAGPEKAKKEGGSQVLATAAAHGQLELFYA